MNSPNETSLQSSEPAADSENKDGLGHHGATQTNRPFSEINLPFRRSNASLSTLFASTSLANSRKRLSSPLIGRLSRKSSTTSMPPPNPLEGSGIYRETIIRSFAPRIAVLPSTDTEELLAQKGIRGGFLQLIRPYGENVSGKVTIRDITGASKSHEDYSVHFVKMRDGLEGPRAPDRRSTEVRAGTINGLVDETFKGTAARLRTGGDIQLVEDAVSKHLAYYESQFNAAEDDQLLQELTAEDASTVASAFHLLYLRRLLSGLPVSPHETFAHPVACVIVISSRSRDPIEQLRGLYNETSSGEQRFPQWVNNDFLRYYVLLHDEDFDDITRSLTLFEQMKRHFGIHCHLLRIKSKQAVPSEEDCVQLPTCEWLAAAEELSEIQRRDDLDGLGPFLAESDEASIRSFVRELVTQSVVPLMERMVATWNDQVASRRRGIGGRFLSLSKKWSFGSSRNASTGGPSSGSNYDSLQGFYRPDTPEAILRRLADYALMLRDFKLAYSTYDLLRSDFQTDKAWKHAAGANEMCAIAALLGNQSLPAGNPRGTSKTPPDGSIEQMLDTACYSYITRCNAPYYALRTLVVAVELLSLRSGSGGDDAARWACKAAELDLIGTVGHALFAERVALSFAARRGTNSSSLGARRRKSALWNVLATQDWVRLENTKQAERCLADVFKCYHVGPTKAVETLPFSGMAMTLGELRDAVTERKGTMEAFASDGIGMQFEIRDEVDQSAHEYEPSEKEDIRRHRHSLIGISTAPVIMTEDGHGTGK